MRFHITVNIPNNRSTWKTIPYATNMHKINRKYLNIVWRKDSGRKNIKPKSKDLYIPVANISKSKSAGR